MFCSLEKNLFYDLHGAIQGNRSAFNWQNEFRGWWMKFGMSAYAPKRVDTFCGFILALGLALIFPSTIPAQASIPATTMKQAAATSARDLSGVWMVKRKRSVSLLTDAKQEPPLTAWGRAQLKPVKSADPKNRSGSSGADDPHKYCDPVGVPRADLTARPIEIVGTPDEVFIFYEEDHSWRQIYMDGRALPEGLDPSFLGYSVGKWDGDTLVVDTVGLNDKTWLDDAGHPHSDALRVVERIRRIGTDTLQIILTIEDPKAYSKTWTSAPRTFDRKRGYELAENYCVAADSIGARKAETPSASPEK